MPLRILVFCHAGVVVQGRVPNPSIRSNLDLEHREAHARHRLRRGRHVLPAVAHSAVAPHLIHLLTLDLGTLLLCIFHRTPTEALI